MEEKTSVEWLFSRIVEEWGLDIEERDNAILEQAKEMEKQQIIDAYEDGTYHNTFGNENYESPEDYYNKIFKK
jgi:HEPN domain-containing protein